MSQNPSISFFFCFYITVLNAIPKQKTPSVQPIITSSDWTTINGLLKEFHAIAFDFERSEVFSMSLKWLGFFFGFC